MSMLASFAAIKPHAAFTHGLAGKWSYLARACSGAEQPLNVLESVIRKLFIPSIIGHAPSNSERTLLGLPAQLGGLGLPNPSAEASSVYKRATQVTKPLVEHILHQRVTPVSEVFCDQLKAIMNKLFI